MNENDLDQSLRKAVAEGKSVNDLVRLIYDFYNLKGYHATIVSQCLMHAFGVRFGQIKEIAHAKAVLGGTHGDEEIDRILLPVLRDALRRESSQQK
jgi:hypothetical protein